MAEPSAVRSMSSQSTSTISKQTERLLLLQRRLADRVFPIYHNLMQKTKFPAWLMSLLAVFMLTQILSVTLWIYTPIFSRIPGNWKKVYSVIVKIFAFSDPLEIGRTDVTELIVVLCIAILSFLWIIAMILYNAKFYDIPVGLMYVTSFILDIVDPLFIMPSVYIIDHGIASLSYNYSSNSVIEVVLGMIAYLLLLTMFILGTSLKTRSIVLSNLAFPLFDHMSITIWVISTTSFSILSAVLKFFDDWIFVVESILHILITCYLTHRLSFIPFYDVWRNGICIAFAITTIVMDLNMIVLFIDEDLPYRFTVFVCLGAFIISFISAYFYIEQKVKKIRAKLTMNDSITNVQEYLEEIKVGKSPFYAMMYIVVGLAYNCDLFIDGSLIDYIMNQPNLCSAFPILLQVVTFFPSESRKMDVLFKRIVSSRKLSLSDRFLIYQVSMIKTRRLISDSKETLETYNKLKIRNDHCKTIISGFWDKTHCTDSFISSLSALISDVDSFFTASLQNNPNNLRLRKEYANFLTECKCDFNQAIKQSIIVESIGNGRNFNVDVSFRSLINKFPKYLKENILDCKGKRITERKRKGGNSQSEERSSSSNSSKNIGSLSSSLSVDIEQQEIVCKQILRDAKVRLAFHNSVDEMKPRQSKQIVILIFSILALSLAFYFAFFFYMRSTLAWRKTSHEDIGSAAFTLFYNMMTNIYTLVVFSVVTGRFDGSEEILGNLTMDEYIYPPLVPIDITFPQMLLYCVSKMRFYLNELLNNVAELAKKNNAYEITGVLLSMSSTFKVCANAKPDYIIPASLKQQIVTVAYLQSTITGDINLGQLSMNIYQNNDYCQIAANLPIIGKNSDDVIQSLLDYNLDMSDDYFKIFVIWIIVGSVSMLALLGIPSFMIVHSYNKRINAMLKVLTALPNVVKEDAKKPLMISNEESEMIPSSNSVEKSYIMVILPIIYFFFLTLVIVFYVLLCWNSVEMNQDLTKILQWYHYSSERIALAAQVGTYAVQLILLNGSLEQEVVNVSDLHTYTKNDLERLMEANNILIYGNDEVPSSIGFDEQFDSIQLKNLCDLGRDPESMHDMYGCTGIDNLLRSFKTIVSDILKKPEMFEGSFKSAEAVNLIHMLRTHIYPSVHEASNRIALLMEETYDSKMMYSIIYLVCGMICILVTSIIPIFFRKYVNLNFKSFLMLIQHLSPQTVIGTKEIMEFFMGKSKSSDEDSMSLSKSVVYNANECIIITNGSSVVEIINKSVTENIGLTPDQMLGQQIANFVSADNQAKLNGQIDLMNSGQGSDIWQDHIELINDNMEPIPFAVTMIAIKEPDSQCISSIVFILTNEEEEIAKRKEAEEAKATSEKLLYQILPKDIVVRLNRGETDISFTIKSATIFFIDIVKFSTYASLLTPSEIMANLSLVFATFDKIVSKYETITKIKLIGDVYMAASGLFMGEDDDPSKHAEESVRCCLECSKSLDEINAKLNASLEVRIGVNSGGPLIGGVLGQDKPTFDIIGDPINVAARLQSTDIPGNVQISEDTKKLIENLDFSIEERGEVFLKGKGNRMTYFVSSHASNEPDGSFIMTLDASK